MSNMKRLGDNAVHLSKEPSGFPDSEDVDTRGTESNIEDTNMTFGALAAAEQLH